MIGSIFRQVFGQRQSEVDQIEDEYHRLLVDLASGADVDIEDVKTLTVDAGKSEEQCSRDLELMEQRIERIRERENWLKLESEVPDLRSKLDILKSELDAVVARVQPQINELSQQLFERSVASANAVRIEVWLNENCLNQALIQRELEVSSQRQETAAKMKPLSDDLEIAKQRISYFDARLENFVDRRDGWKPRTDSDQGRELETLQANRDHAASIAGQLERELELLREELVPIDEELRDIQAQKLQP